MHSTILLQALLTCTLLFSAQGTFQGSDYGKTFNGEGTFYGFSTGGNCGMGSKWDLPKMYHSMLPVAINHEQYANSASCGACLKVTGHGNGIGTTPITGTFYAYVHDHCYECKKGDLDLSSSGDGRWNISFKFIPCPNNQPELLFEGSNDYYKKIQIRGLTYPAWGMHINGKRGDRSQDNFFVSYNGPFPQRGMIRVKDVMGNVYKAWMRMNIGAGTLTPPPAFFTPLHKKKNTTNSSNSSSNTQSNGNGGQNGNGNGQSKSNPGAESHCVGNWMPCTDPNANGANRKECCSNRYVCKPLAWSRSWHCLQKY